MAVADTDKTIDDFTRDDFSLLLGLCGEVGLSVAVDAADEYDAMMETFSDGRSWYKSCLDPSRGKDSLVVKELLLPHGNNYGPKSDSVHKELYLHAYILPFSRDALEFRRLQERYYELVRERFGT